jgi:hypothetical protein
MKDFVDAEAKTEELEKAAWPDEKGRQAKFSRSFAYMNQHSDKIFSAAPGMVKESAASNEERIYNLQTRFMKYNPDGKRAIRDSINKVIFQNVTMKNYLMLSERHMVHYYTGDSREYMVLTEYKSLTDMQTALPKSEEIGKAAFTEKQSKDMSSALRTYYSHHGDKLFTSIPGLRK